MARASIFRLVAVALLLFTGAELFACEIIAPEECESFGIPQEDSSQRRDDNCLCCCAHVIASEPIHIDPVANVLTILDSVEPPTVERQPSTVYHPPRS